MSKFNINAFNIDVKQKIVNINASYEVAPLRFSSVNVSLPLDFDEGATISHTETKAKEAAKAALLDLASKF